MFDLETRWFVIVNPVAGSGRGLKDWPIISKLLRDHAIGYDAVFTEKKYHATELAVEAVNKGYRRIVVVGGDGTLHETVNGLFIQQQCATTDVLLAVIAVGTGNDWIRMYGIPRKYTEAISAIVAGHSFLQDAGRISYYESFVHQVRYMANVAGLGFDASVNRTYNRLKERGFYNKWLYIVGTFLMVFRFRSKRFTVRVDDKEVLRDAPVFSGAIGIGQYNGGGMQQMPHAVADDGLFDMTMIRRLNNLKVFLHFRSLYNGTIYHIPQVMFFRGAKITVESVPESPVEVDGEALGYSPFEFSVVPKALRVIVGERFAERSGQDGKAEEADRLAISSCNGTKK